jgi:hypothetical protein
LVIIDAWADLFNGNTNDVGDVRRALNRFSEAAEKFGFAVVILHHTVKNSENFNPNKNRLNGSQGIEAKLRALIEVRKGDDNERILSILKGNYISGKQKDKSLVLNFDEDKLLFHPTGKTLNKNSILSREGNRFSDDPELCGLITKLKQDGLSFTAIRERLIDELGEDRTPKVTMLKNIYNRSIGQPNT